MKTQNFLYRLLLALPLLLALAACGGKDNSNISGDTQYAYSTNGVCYDQGTGQPTSYLNCGVANYNSSMYHWDGTTCTDMTSGIAVPTLYCTSNPFQLSTYQDGSSRCIDTSTNRIVAGQYCNKATTTAQCVGTYYYQYTGTQQPIQCYGSNCRGYTLVEYTTGRTVNCQ